MYSPIAVVMVVAAASLLAALGSSASANSNVGIDTTWGDVKGWTVGMNNASRSCAAVTTYTDNTKMWTGFDANRQPFLAITNPNWTGITDDRSYELTFRAQRRSKWTGTFKGMHFNAHGGYFLPNLNLGFVKDWALSSGVTIDVDGRRIAGFSLRGSMAALGMLVECQKSANVMYANAPASTQPAAVTKAKDSVTDQTVGSGTGFFVSGDGHLLTNFHVAGRCQTLTARLADEPPVAAKVVASDKINDLTLVQLNLRPASFGRFQKTVRLGETVFTFGYPLDSLLATSGNFTTGSVTALAGLGDDSRMLQFSAPVQPGNSGGALIDTFGNVIGVVTAKLNASVLASATGDIAQNVNFALKASIASAFLETSGIVPSQATGEEPKLEAPDVADRAKTFSVKLFCASSAEASTAP